MKVIKNLVIGCKNFWVDKQRKLFAAKMQSKISAYLADVADFENRTEKSEQANGRELLSQNMKIKPLYLFTPRDALQLKGFVKLLQSFHTEPLDYNLIGVNSEAMGWVYGNYSYNIKHNVLYYNFIPFTPNLNCEFRCGGKVIDKSLSNIYSIDYLVNISIDSQTKELSKLYLSENWKFYKTGADGHFSLFDYEEAENIFVSYATENLYALKRSKVITDFLLAKKKLTSSTWDSVY